MNEIKVTELTRGKIFKFSNRKNAKVYGVANDAEVICEENKYKNPPPEKVGKIFVACFDSNGKCVQFVFGPEDRVIASEMPPIDEMYHIR